MLVKEAPDVEIDATLRAYRNPLWPGDALWLNKSGSTLAQVMACCLTAFENTQIMKLQYLLDLNTETCPVFFYSFSIVAQGAHHSHDTRQRDQEQNVMITGCGYIFLNW